MKQDTAGKVHFLETSDLFLERESGRLHTPYETEQRFYACIESGDADRVQVMMQQLLAGAVVAGRMAEHPLTRMKYWAVACITLATRAAIRGGMDETEAFNYSDENIFKIDRMSDEGAILRYLQEICVRLTARVAESRRTRSYPPAIRKCLHYIHANLHVELSAAILAAQCGLTPAYLSRLFASAVGCSLRAYVRDCRLRYAKEMLAGEKSTSEIAYDLGFCSESYFIKCFREAYGITPGEMRRKIS